MGQPTTTNYQIQNSSLSKSLVLVVQIEGLSYVIGSSVISQALKYGTPGINYGDPGLTYGGNVPFGGIVNGSYNPDKQRPLLSMDGSSFNLSQKTDAWTGKASVSQINFTLTDVNSQAMRIISPGQELNEILLKKFRFFVGYSNLDFPSDYLLLTKGVISNVTVTPGQVTLTASDPNILRRQKLFEKAQTTTTAAITSSATSIPVVSTDGFYKLVNAPNQSAPEAGHAVGVMIDDEIILYTQDPGSITFTNVTRGALGTIAAAHDIGAEVTPFFFYSGNPLLIACKLMLSGWGGAPSVTGVKVSSIVATGDPTLPTVDNSYVFSVDMKDAYGLEIGDFISCSGTSVPRNGIFERPIISFFDVNGVRNSGIVVSLEAAPASETQSTGIASFRSQFDVYPTACGLKMDMGSVDTARHIDITTQFLSTADFAFMNTSEIDQGKDHIESQLYLPCAAFSLTRGGKCSVVLTAQPLPGVQLITLNKYNVIDPDKAVFQRGVTSRKYYSRVDFSYDATATTGTTEYATYAKYINSTSLAQIPYREYLQIESLGMRSDRGAQALINRAVRKVFERYAYAAQTIQFKVTWQVGALLEAGDVVLIDDSGDLNFPNLQTGQRGLGLQLWEVLEKSLDLKTGQASLTIINAAGNVTDRFGLIAPSSIVLSGSSTSKFRIQSQTFGNVFPNADWKKWSDYQGYKIIIHSEDYSYSETTTFTSYDASDPFSFNVSPPLSQVPQAGMIIDIAPYSTGDANDQKLIKAIHAFASPAVSIVSIDTTNYNFTVSTQDAAKFFIGSSIFITHSASQTEYVETTVTSIVGTTIGYAPVTITSTTDLLCLGIGFSADKSQTYRSYS